MRKRSFRAEREFGLVVGGVFALLSGWWIYRGKFQNVAYVTESLGLVLVVLGLIFPRILVYPNRAWMLLAGGLSFLSTRMIPAARWIEPLLLEALLRSAAQSASLRKDVLKELRCQKYRWLANSGSS